MALRESGDEQKNMRQSGRGWFSGPFSGRSSQGGQRGSTNGSHHRNPPNSTSRAGPNSSLDDNILRQSALSRGNRGSSTRNLSSAMPFRRGTVNSGNAMHGPTSAASLPSSLATAGNQNHHNNFGGGGAGTNTGSNSNPGHTGSTNGSDHDKHGRDSNGRVTTYRRYRVGDSVLVCNIQQNPSLANNLVNRYGYTAGGGVTPEEQRGPYIFVLATVVKVHFEEDREYYTVTRADTGADQRSDAGK